MEKFRIRHACNAQPHYLYDLALPLPERIAKRMLFPSAIAMASFLGVSPQRIYASRSTKHKIWSEAQQGWFAVRIASTQIQIK
jgi:hypothetical protein